MSTSMQPLAATVYAANPTPDGGGGSLAGSAAGKQPRTRDLWKNLVGYAAAVCLSVLVTAVALKLWRARLDVPLFDSGDNLMGQMFVQNTLETGWFLDNGRLGAPGALDLRDYPLADVFHVAIIKLLGYVYPNSAVVLNLYYLLAFPLTALTCYFVLRRFKLGRLAALVPSVLYSCTLYHFLRTHGHLFLAAYYLLPPMIWVIVRVYLGRNPFLQANPDNGRPRWRMLSWEAAGAVLMCVLTGLAGVYYAFFSCFLLLMAGARAAFRERRWAPLAATVLLILLIVGAVGAALSPSFVQMARYGKNSQASVRLPAEADNYGLNVTAMLLPIHDNRIRFLSRIHDHYFAPPRQLSEAVFTALGLVASLGFIYLVGRFLWRRGGKVERIDDGLAYLNVAAVMLGTIGGVGSSFAFYVTPMIRCYDRLSIFIAFFALAGLFLVLERLADRHLKSRWARVGFAGALIALLGLGAVDQTPAFLVPPYAQTQEQAASDAEFGKRMEATLPPAAMVYQMPYAPFPEFGPVEHLNDYELLRPFLHTRTLRFSYGAMKGRETSCWQAAVADRPLAEQVEQLAFAGFSGIYLDRAGFADTGVVAEAELSRLLGAAPLESLNRRQTFFDMRGYVQTLRSRFTDEEWDARRQGALHPIEVTWGAGFGGPENTVDQGICRWNAARGELGVSNSLDRPRRVVFNMECSGWQENPVHLVVDGDLIHQEWPLTLEPGPIELDLLVPAGNHFLTFTCDGPRLPAPADPREIYYRMARIRWRGED